MNWQASNGYGKRSLSRPPSDDTIDRRAAFAARSLPVQQTEVAIGCAVFNRKLAGRTPEIRPQGSHSIVCHFKDAHPLKSGSLHQTWAAGFASRSVCIENVEGLVCILTIEASHSPRIDLRRLAAKDVVDRPGTVHFNTSAELIAAVNLVWRVALVLPAYNRACMLSVGHRRSPVLRIAVIPLGYTQRYLQACGCE